MSTITHTDPPAAGSEFRLTTRDLNLLWFVAAHRFVLAAHVQAWLDAARVPTYRRLHGLVQAGYLSHRRVFYGRPGAYAITRLGLGAIESEMPRPMLDLHTYRHDTLLVALYLAAQAPGLTVLSEREVRVRDHAGGWDVRRRAIAIGDLGAGAKPHVHHPDVIVETIGGERLAVELELTLKSRSRLEEILVGYRGAPGMRRVVYLTDRPAIATAARVGCAHLIDTRLTPAKLTEHDAIIPPAVFTELFAETWR